MVHLGAYVLFLTQDLGRSLRVCISIRLPGPVEATGSTDLEQLGFEEILLNGVCAAFTTPEGSCDLPFTALTLAEALGVCEK